MSLSRLTGLFKPKIRLSIAALLAFVFILSEARSIQNVGLLVIESLPSVPMVTNHIGVFRGMKRLTLSGFFGPHVSSTSVIGT